MDSVGGQHGIASFDRLPAPLLNDVRTFHDPPRFELDWRELRS